jgi:hypothetical protein
MVASPYSKFGAPMTSIGQHQPNLARSGASREFPGERL